MFPTSLQVELTAQQMPQGVAVPAVREVNSGKVRAAAVQAGSEAAQLGATARLVEKRQQAVVQAAEDLPPNCLLLTVSLPSI